MRVTNHVFFMIKTAQEFLEWSKIWQKISPTFKLCFDTLRLSKVVFKVDTVILECIWDNNQ